MSNSFVFARRAITFGLLSLSAAALLMLGGCDSGGKGGRTKVVNTEVEVMTLVPQDVEFSRMITGRTALSALRKCARRFPASSRNAFLPKVLT